MACVCVFGCVCVCAGVCIRGVGWYSRESTQKLIEELKGKLASATQETLSAEQRSKLMESTMQAEEKRQEQLHNEISNVSQLNFKRGNELHAMKLKKRHIDTEMQVTNHSLIT